MDQNYVESEAYLWAYSRGIDDDYIWAVLLVFERYSRPSYRIVKEEAQDAYIELKRIEVPKNDIERKALYSGIMRNVERVINVPELFTHYRAKDDTLFIVPNWRFLKGYCERNEYWRKSDAGRKGGRPAKKQSKSKAKAKQKQKESRTKAE